MSGYGGTQSDQSDDGTPSPSTPPAPIQMHDMSGAKTPESALSISSESAPLFMLKKRVDDSTALKLQKVVLGISIFSVVYLGIMGVTVLIIGIIDKSPASFAFALDALLDTLSSIVLIWRYTGSTALYNERRERNACITLGILFIISAISITSRSSVSLAQRIYPSRSTLIIKVALANLVVCLGLGLVKLVLAWKLESMSVFTDALNSLMGFVVSMSMVIADSIYEKHPQVWYVDPSIGIIVSVVLFIYGTWITASELRKIYIERKQGKLLSNDG